MCKILARRRCQPTWRIIAAPTDIITYLASSNGRRVVRHAECLVLVVRYRRGASPPGGLYFRISPRLLLAGKCRR